jgi:Zn-dependent protease
MRSDCAPRRVVAHHPSGGTRAGQPPSIAAFEGVRWRGSSHRSEVRSQRENPTFLAAANDASKEFDIRIGSIISGAWFNAELAPCALLATSITMPDTGTVGLILSLVLLVICLGIHEAAHAWVALKCGDPTGRDLGRITLNPIPHIDPFMTIILPGIMLLTTGFIFGGAKPVPVNFHRLRHPWRDMSLVALAGPLSNFCLALIFMAARKFFLKTGFYNDASQSPLLRQEDLLPQVLWSAVSFNVLLAVFNLVPIPPLDGSRVMAWLLPQGVREPYVAMERYGLLIVFGLATFSAGFSNMLHVTMNAMTTLLQRIVSLGGVW